ncbi:MAG TPA: IS200/IS605 family transposase [Epsilonproteobacteria bacterium]|nr:IS200/IS605 family transposase [Campylobacterota bacterium]
MDEYRANKNIVFSCRYHVVWCPKYRRKVLTEDIAKRLREIIEELASPLNVDIIEMKIDKDSIHILIDVDPQFGVIKFIKLVKKRSSRVLREEFTHLKTKLPTLWSNSSFIATVGDLQPDAIRQYIENQQTSERQKEKHKWKEYLSALSKNPQGI